MEALLALARRVRQSVGSERVWTVVRPSYWRVVDAVTRRRGVAMRLADGHRYRIDARHYAYEPERYDADVMRVILTALREDSVVYDIGAHVGIMTMVMARRLRPATRRAGAERGRVYAFEPSPENLMRLRRNVRRNRMDDRVTIVPALVGERTSEAVEFAYMPWNCTLNSLARRPPGSVTARVPMASIDDLIARGRIPAPDIVKIDVEGYERAVLHGARRWLRAANPTVVCALHPDELSLLGTTTDAVLDDMARLGYGAFDLTGREVSSCGFCDVVFRRRGPWV
jgi:FkbM family methyltransferase